MNSQITLSRCVSSKGPFTRSIRGYVTVALLIGSLSSALSATFKVAAGGIFPNFVYNPKVISIQAGDTVIWTGLGTTHSVTGRSTNETLCGATFPGSCTNTFNTAGTYLYYCVSHVTFGMTGVVNVAAAPLPLTVNISSPADGRVFAAPASVHIVAAVTTNSASVTNVQYFSNGNLMGAATTAPFTFTTPSLSSGAYAFTAQATDGTGVSATSAPVHISVVTPVAVSNFFPRVANGQFAFNFTANPGLRYAVQNTTNFATWSPVVTNTAVSNSVEVIDAFQAGGLRFYRVGRIPD